MVSKYIAMPGPPHPKKALERIINNMKWFECWQDSYLAYLHAVPGDLTQPHLGMTEENWQLLTREVDAVYHNGAVLNFVFPLPADETCQCTGHC